jgi:hypothetical protein
MLRFIERSIEISQMFFKYIGFILLPILMIGCSQGNRHKNNIYLARVGSSYLTLRKAKSQIPGYVYKRDSIKALKRYRSDWIKQQLQLNEAKRLHLAQQEKVQKRLAETRKEVLLNALKKKITDKNKKRTSVSDSEVLHYFHQHQKKFVLNERFVKFRHVATHNFSEALKAHRELKDDSSWVAVARHFSLNPEEKIQKSTKFWPVSALFHNLPPMKKYISRLDSGQFSPIKRYKGIYHFVQVVDIRKKRDTADPQWFNAQLKEWLVVDKQHKYYQSYIKKLYFKARNNNEIHLFHVSASKNNKNDVKKDLR